MKLGILGTGMIVKDVLTMYHELGVEKTYLFSTKKSKSQALELMKKYHLDKVYTDYDELLQSDVDTIYCALPNHLHYEFSKKALENDKNVIIEKPITANSKELEDLIETANKKNLMIFEAMNLHYIPAFLSLKEDLKKLGDIKIVSFNYSQYSSRYNAFKEGTILPAFDFHKAGGALMDLNVYNIHALIDLFGKPVLVSSGFRSNDLNRAVGGAATSQHMKGEAADIYTGTKEGNKKLFELIRDNLPFDQLIDEKDFSWVHVSFKEIGNRKQILKL